MWCGIVVPTYPIHNTHLHFQIAIPWQTEFSKCTPSKDPILHADGRNKNV